MENSITVTLLELPSLAERFVSSLQSYNDHATVVGLIGDLGAGKTAFTKCVALVLGVSGEVTSPTFVIEKRYVTEHERFSQLIHIDAYRLSGREELDRLRFSETCANPHTLVIIEWPTQVEGALPTDARFLTFTTISDGIRQIEGLTV